VILPSCWLVLLWRDGHVQATEQSFPTARSNITSESPARSNVPIWVQSNLAITMVALQGTISL